MTQKIPKIIWSMWYQGTDKAPEWAKLCWETFSIQNPEWELRIITDENISKWIPNHLEYCRFVNRSKGWNNRDETWRLCLLKKYGGVWVDASVICTKPLDNWLHSSCSDGFFVFKAPSTKERFILSNFFIASTPDNLIINKWIEKCKEHLDRVPYKNEYFYPHNTYKYLYNTDKYFKSIHDNMVTISRHSVHVLQKKEKDHKVIINIAPIQKLNGTKEKFHDYYKKFIMFVLNNHEISESKLISDV